MEYTNLGGPEGPRVSTLCLGTLPFGTRIDEATAFAVLDRFHEAGGTFIDTANTYAFWEPGATGAESELVIGRWLRSRGVRDEMVIATKVGALPEPLDAAWPEYAEGLSTPVLRRQVERSLRNLGTDHIDLYYAHIDDRATPVAETMAAFGELEDAGKIGRAGCSNFAAWRIEESRAAAALAGVPDYAAVQQRYTYLRPAPGAEFGVNPHASEELLDYLGTRPELTFTAYTTQLTGAYTDPRKEVPEQYRHAGSERRLKALAEAAAELGVTANQAVLAWAMGGALPVLPVIGASSTAQLDETLGAVGLRLDAELRKRLDDVD
ncbi:MULTISPECIES: aldo/keto reductase [unclassified Streptomyces]|uniref:aldo/keto reductase n=1 Tax=unclassified Streptomyces TaxID=2593676 RepID=UPI0016612BFD|nr:MULTISPECIES: aldo/keto reductase [unclassified Streptomyces]MBD0707453.1 oxidoreductase [Streptomyces sp. CBMA291]MBD0715095.1 oxidoreductase [Streptomyces sp. CBMA370]